LHSLYLDANFSSSLVCGGQQISIVLWIVIASVPSLKEGRKNWSLFVASSDNKVGPSSNVSHAETGSSARFG